MEAFLLAPLGALFLNTVFGSLLPLPIKPSSEQGSMVSHLCLRVNLSHLDSPCGVSSNSPLKEQSCNL